MSHGVKEAAPPGVGRAMIEIGVEPRSCECCGAQNPELIWSSQSIVTRATSTWRFPFNVSICPKCGFCFASPAPKYSDLQRYHADGLSGYKNIGLPYSIDARIAVLERYKAPTGTFAEIGGDEPGEFHRRCASLFRNQVVVEIAEDSPAEFRSVHDLPEASVDVLAHYDVLEHVVDLNVFLEACRRCLKPGGVMICEVPDIRLYPRNLLILEFEHVNHFSVATLKAVAHKAGLNLIEIGHRCSRPWGLLSVFRKEAVDAGITLDPRCEYLDALACVRGGIEQVALNEELIDQVREEIRQLGAVGEKITLWAVTDQLRKLLDGFTLPSSAQIVDSDPRKKDHLASIGLDVLRPVDGIEHISESKLLVICAPRYRSEILEWIAENAHKHFSGIQLRVIGAGPSGETLI